jgi:hypothetical protein
MPKVNTPMLRRSAAEMPVADALEDSAQQGHCHVQHQQLVEEPEVRERKGARNLGHFGHGRWRTVEHLGDAHRPDQADDRKQNDPAGDQRHGDAQTAVFPETARAEFVIQHAAEESGDEEEQRHAEDVRDKTCVTQELAGGVVHHRPDSRRDSRQERHRGMERHA